MREIKFRAYIKKDYSKELVGKIFEVSSIHLKTKKAIIGFSISKSHYGNKSFSFEDIELMQFTGLKDKNGKEIYEGDIVKATILTEEELEIKGQVIYCSCASYIVICENDDEYGLSWLDELEVIGNIYDNPELLEVQDE